MARVRDLHGGRDNDPRFGSRMRGEGVFGRLLALRFQQAARRLGLNRERIELDLSQFVRPRRTGNAAQRELF